MKLAAGGVLVTALLVSGAFAPWLSPYSPEEMDISQRLAGPSFEHWLGTDNFGRDLWSRTTHGSRFSLGIGLVSVTVSAILGTAVGLLAGYAGGLIDQLLMRFVDLFLGFPPFVLVLAVVAALGPGVAPVIVALVAVFWTEYARVARAVTLSETARDYVVAARSLGASPTRILLRQILPRAAGPLAVLATLGLGTAIVAESGLSFLGFGVPPPSPTWGWTLAYGMRYMRTDIWLSTVPGLAILVSVFAFNLLGDGLRDRLDPRGLARRTDGS